ncbi:hypothetical protein CO172_01060 [Candidatus Uhrbacteria bacterium CG_4_9_14_3_um_filter_36_7]|uniref:DNA polymerase III subunit gamma/tau n=1 Tax=Candidatus Uhrbacteria bacterium CG_4_9_14_3_um_filter_36_7 TaxID=1975033 RepID=A0A2M7XI18_9BACT|nr:MAG: hypothetical protein CO172_01060 [Candidatus Uhrbacteria bacterium CG_4_9_14_3_um_filter_36_7]
MLTIYRKYRPQTFKTMVGQEPIKQTIQNELEQGNLAHAFLFTGSRGIGKTTMARLLAKAVNCTSHPYKAHIPDPKRREPCNDCLSCKAIIDGSAIDVIEIDAASHTGVDHIREQIIEQTRFHPQGSTFKVFIIDEVHMLSLSAFNALLKTLEEPPDHVIFILATTEIHKVPETVISRCQRFDFQRLKADTLVRRLKDILVQESVEIDDFVLYEIVRQSEGCVRDAESFLGQILSIGKKHIGIEEASLVLPVVHTQQLLTFTDHFFNRRIIECLRMIHDFRDQGIDLEYFLEDFIRILRSILFIQIADKAFITDEFPLDIQEKLNAFSFQKSNSELVLLLEQMVEARHQMKTDFISSLAFELVLIRFGSLKQDEHRLEKKSEEISKDSSEEQKELDKSSNDSLPNDLSNNSSTPLFSLEDIKEKWPHIIEQLKQTCASVALILQAGTLLQLQGEELQVVFEYRFHADTLNEVKHGLLIEEVLEKIMGKRIRFQAIYQKLSADLETEATLSRLLDAFGGTAV